jgi:methanogenic corrinoid protein MtbC1
MAKLQGEAPLATLRTDCTLVAACADSELHAVGLRMVCDLLEQRGWDVSYLGAAVPSADLGAMVRDRRPTVVALSASTTSYIPKLRSMIEAVRAGEDTPTPYVLVGGRPFLADPSLALSVGADSFARDADEAVELLGERFG